jgi:hypothetical protein
VKPTTPARVVILADTHCGSRSGLTPPGWGYQAGSGDTDRETWATWQDALWAEYARICQKLQPVDLLICNGDMVDGRGAKTGGVEELEADRAKQARMAARCIEEMHALRILLVAGTPYHSAEDGEDWDAAVAEHVTCEVLGTEGYVNVRGLVFHVKHFAPSSIIPHGRFTGPAREYLWLALRALHHDCPRADVVVRSHAHYGIDAGNRYWRVIVTPGMQGFTRYGRKTGLREVDLGVTEFNVTSREEWTWKTHWIDLPQVAAPVITL